MSGLSRGDRHDLDISIPVTRYTTWSLQSYVYMSEDCERLLSSNDSLPVIPKLLRSDHEIYNNNSSFIDYKLWSSVYDHGSPRSMKDQCLRQAGNEI